MSGSASQIIDTGTEFVKAEIASGVGVVTLNRPERRNALHPEMYDTVPKMLDRFARDDSIGSVLITGAGSAFCAGGDVRDGRSGGGQPSAAGEGINLDENAAELTRKARIVQLLREMPKVTIAALPGAAVGAGMSIALSADLRIAARSATLVPGWGQLAFSGDFGGAWFLSRLVGPSRALQLLIDGEPIDSHAALQLGLVNRIVDDADLGAAAFRWAVQIAAGPTAAWASVKANVLDAQALPLEEALVRESERMVKCALTDEHRRAVQAWLKRGTNIAEHRSHK